MPVHHIAFATTDVDATDAFYTDAMGFELVKVEVAETPHGYAKHLFYDTGGGGLIAFWDLHDDTLVPTSTAISTGFGLPEWVNHLAFDAADVDDLDARRRRLTGHGHYVAEIDHGWCRSIYVKDPNGILVEFCTTTRALTADDAAEARRLLADANPQVLPAPSVAIHEPSVAAATPA